MGIRMCIYDVSRGVFDEMADLFTDRPQYGMVEYEGTQYRGVMTIEIKKSDSDTTRKVLGLISDILKKY